MPKRCVVFQAVDFSALSAQAAAQVERARAAAQQQLADALKSKPRLALRLFMEAPKVAIPVPTTAEGQGVVDLPVSFATSVGISK